MSHDMWIVLSTAAIGVVVSVVGFICVKVWNRITELEAQKESSEVEATRELVKETHMNTIAIVELKAMIGFLTEKLSPVPKMQSDISALHAWKRNFSNETPENGGNT